MIFTESDVNKILNTGDVLQGDNTVASVELTDCYEVYALSTLNEKTYSKTFTDVKDVVDFLNKLERMKPIITPCNLSEKEYATLQTMSDYYEANCNGNHNSPYFWNLLSQVHEYCISKTHCEMTDKEFSRLAKWFRKATKDSHWEDVYWNYANEGIEQP